SGLLWLARARSAAGRYAAACSAARAGIDGARDPDLAAMLRAEAGAACEIRADAAPTADPAPAPTADPGSAPAAAPPGGAFAAQTGAFRLRESAGALVERLRAAGFEPRLVRLSGSDLLRVRLGRFADRAAAARLVARLEARGFEALVVGDAHRERQP
ncbi:MAG: hypothetical protein GWM90_18265, partial [Gemmatimonadetes bacterium]|nr:hypothetical protein [Gemmatimonadota bacterium]NIQ56295.1 hypothetical protein [Gemmatimonadota bacterium]NIU76481.1 hypothetical protein [Gammaproteobacteria bacterium]NIX45966.1 hypothetical protein [Gemmatimonadota bacterium]NIY10282.1 hypothetical protein [Gemmatimonadota bacterium]